MFFNSYVNIFKLGPQMNLINKIVCQAEIKKKDQK